MVNMYFVKIKVLEGVIVLHIVLTLYRLSLAQFCDTQKFGRCSDSGIIRILYGVSLPVCHKECLLRTSCKSYGFRKRFGECKMHSETVSNICALEICSETIYKNILESERMTDDLDKCKGHTCQEMHVCASTHEGSSCEIKECSKLSVYSDANMDILGNMNSVGSRVKLQCKPGATLIGNANNECQNTGQWTSASSRCVFICGELPDSVPDATLEVTKSVNITVNSVINFMEGSEITYTCQNGKVITTGSKIVACSQGSWGTPPTCGHIMNEVCSIGSDCNTKVTNAECRSGYCRCKPYTSYNAISGSCNKTCPAFVQSFHYISLTHVRGFQVFEGIHLAGAEGIYNAGAHLSSCLTTCISMPNCASAELRDHGNGGFMCDLYSVTAAYWSDIQTTGDRAAITTYYQRDCA